MSIATRTARRHRNIRNGLALALGIALGTAIVFAWPSPKRDYLIPGDQWLGEPIADPVAAVLLYPTPMHVRAGCFWGRPGASRWRGNDYSALRAMFVEPDVALDLVDAIRAKRSVARVYRSNLGIRTWQGGVEIRTAQGVVRFSPISAQAFGTNIVCFGTTANFRTDDREEAGDLYHADGVWIAVWDACGNVDRLIPIQDARPGSGPQTGGASRERARTAALLYPLVRHRPELRGVPVPRRASRAPEAFPIAAVHAVPEPATWALVLLGFPVVAWSRRRRAQA